MEELKKIICSHPKYVRAIKEIQKAERNRLFCLHNKEHFLEVYRIMKILNKEMCFSFSKEELYITSMLHDLGRCKKNQKNHAKNGAVIAKKILTDIGFDRFKVRKITDAIKSHSKSIVNEKLAFLLQKADIYSRSCSQCNMREECYWSDELKNHRKF